MSKGNFGAGIIGFILGILTCGFYAIFKRKKEEEEANRIQSADQYRIEEGPKC